MNETGSRLSCLVVDDDLMILSLMREFMRGLGDSCSPATSAQEALALLAKGCFDLLISDLQMAGMNGIELTTRCKQD